MLPQVVDPLQPFRDEVAVVEKRLEHYVENGVCVIGFGCPKGPVNDAYFELCRRVAASRGRPFVWVSLGTSVSWLELPNTKDAKPLMAQITLVGDRVVNFHSALNSIQYKIQTKVIKVMFRDSTKDTLEWWMTHVATDLACRTVLKLPRR